MWRGPWVRIIKYWKEHHLSPWRSCNQRQTTLCWNYGLWKGVSRVTAADDAAVHLHLRPSVRLLRGQSLGCVSLLSGTVGLGGTLPTLEPRHSLHLQTLGLHGRQAWYRGHPQATLWRWYSKKPVCLWGQESLAACRRDCKLIREAELYV